MQEVVKQINDFTKQHKELIIVKLSHTLDTDNDYKNLSQDQWNKLFETLKGINNRFTVEKPGKTDFTNKVLGDFITDRASVFIFAQLPKGIELGKYADQGFFTQDTFVKRGTPFDKLRDIQPGSSAWKTEDVIIDATFSQIFALPTPEHRLVYYHSIITESCKISPGAIAPSLGRAIRFVFRGLESMDAELSYRYMDWLAHHLSNFEFRWKWAEW